MIDANKLISHLMSSAYQVQIVSVEELGDNIRSEGETHLEFNKIRISPTIQE